MKKLFLVFMIVLLSGCTGLHDTEVQQQTPSVNQEKPVYMDSFQKALSNNDETFCDEIGLESKKLWCKAYILEIPELCDYITVQEEQDWCYMDYGMNKKDKGACDNIVDEKTKTSCIAVITKDPDLCFEGEEQYALVCIENLVESLGNLKLCDRLDDEKQEVCYEELSWVQ